MSPRRGSEGGRAAPSLRGAAGASTLLALSVLACAEVRPSAEAVSAPVDPAPTLPSDASAEAAGVPPAEGAPEAEASDAAPPPAKANAAPEPATPAEPPPPRVVRAKLSVGDPRFTAGEVPKAKTSLEKLAPKIVACVDERGGLTTPEGGLLELQFLVTARGVAEGVDVRKASGVGAEAARCVRDLLQRRSVGTPSTDPIGVTVELRLAPAE